jgi:SOS-response transcriptional repressor LexA
MTETPKNELHERLRERIEALELTEEAASLRVGTDRSYFRKLFERPNSHPRTDTLQRIAAALETDVAWLTGGTERRSTGGRSLPSDLGNTSHLGFGSDGGDHGPNPREGSSYSHGDAGGYGGDSTSGFGGNSSSGYGGDSSSGYGGGSHNAGPAGRSTGATPALPARVDMPLDVPVMGTAAGSHLKGAFQFEGGIVDYVRRPPALVGAKEIYGLYVEGTSMEPQYFPGDLIYLHPHRPARIGDIVVVQCRNGEHAPEEATLGIYRRKTERAIVIGKRNPAAEIEIPRERVTAIHRVLTTNELFGV